MSSEILRPEDLIGGYVIVAGERFGQPEPTDRVYGSMVHFTDTTVVVTDKDKKETYAAKYTLDPGRVPCGITMRATSAPNAGDVAHGIIEKTGDTVRLAYGLPGADTPMGFKTQPRQLMFEMKREG